MPRSFKQLFIHYVRELLLEKIGSRWKRTLEDRTGRSKNTTMETLQVGGHVRPANLRVFAQALRLSPLEWIELKIRYCEAFLGKPISRGEPPGVRQLAKIIPPYAFFRLRAKREGKKVTVHKRFAYFVVQRFSEAGQMPLFLKEKRRFRWSADMGEGWSPTEDAGSVCLSETDPSSGGWHAITSKEFLSYSSLMGMLSGKKVSLRSFLALCRYLELDDNQATIARLLYCEAYLGETLLGNDPTVYADLASTGCRTLRSARLLKYSIEYDREVA